MPDRSSIIVSVATALLIAACNPAGQTKEELAEQVDRLEAENTDLQAKVDALSEQLEGARDKVAQVTRAADDVEAAASRFDGENWRDVVPDVQTATDDLDTAKEEASEAVEEQ